MAIIHIQRVAMRIDGISAAATMVTQRKKQTKKFGGCQVVEQNSGTEQRSLYNIIIIRAEICSI